MCQEISDNYTDCRVELAWEEDVPEALLLALQCERILLNVLLLSQLVLQNGRVRAYSSPRRKSE